MKIKMKIKSDFIKLLIVGYIISGIVDVTSALKGKEVYALSAMVVLTILYGIGRFLLSGD